MDNPGLSLFHGTDININNSQYEEGEDEEDQIQRQKELQEALHAKLDNFEYDDSTVNSSTNISGASINIGQDYKGAITQYEQLQVLYDVRCRELQSLQHEFDRYKVENGKEIDSAKNKNLLQEAELRQLKLSLDTAESLLVDKTELINTLNSKLQERESHIKNLEERLRNNEVDLSTYKSEVTELHLKLQSQNGPFNLNAKYNSEELHNSLKDKILKLENALEEEIKKFELCSKEKISLEGKIQRLLMEKGELENENSVILKSIDGAQQQCKDLINVIEMLKNENNHFKSRLHSTEENSFQEPDLTQKTSLNNSELINHNEKLKKMLLDKSVELDTLKTKLRYYENDLKELLEYRQLKTDVYRKEFQKCENSNHTKELLLMQNDLQNYRRVIDDKNQQILNLTSTNKDLKEKIEETLLQTRNDIQNISFKYNVPKLEVMSKELEKAENLVKVLSQKLEESEERRLSLIEKLKSKSEKYDLETTEELRKYKDELKHTKVLLSKERDQNSEIFNELENHKVMVLSLKNELEQLKVEKRMFKLEKNSPTKAEKSEMPNVKDEYEELKAQLTQVMEHLEKNSSKNSSRRESPEVVQEIKNEMDQFLKELNIDNVEKGLLENKISSWKKLLDKLEARDPEAVLKHQYQEALINLHSSNEKLKDMEEVIQDLKNSLTIAEGEKCSLAVELKDAYKKIESTEKLCHHLENENKHLNFLLKEEKHLRNNPKEKNTKNENLDLLISKVQAQLNDKENELLLYKEKITTLKEEKEGLDKRVEILSSEVKLLKEKHSSLENELKEANNKIVRRNLSKEMESQGVQKEDYQSKLEEDVLKAELKLRDELQLEYQKRISDIEKRYQEASKQQSKKLDQQEKQYREYLKTVLTECDKCNKDIEREKLELAMQLKSVQEDFMKYKENVIGMEEKFYSMLKKAEQESAKKVEAWKNWSKKVVSSSLDIEATNKKVRDKVLVNMQRYDTEIAALQKVYDTKIEKKSNKL